MEKLLWHVPRIPDALSPALFGIEPVAFTGIVVINPVFGRPLPDTTKVIHCCGSELMLRKVVDLFVEYILPHLSTLHDGFAAFRSGLRIAGSVIDQCQGYGLQGDGAQSKWFTIADFVAHIFFQRDCQQKGAELVGLKRGEIDAEVEARVVVEWLNIFIAVFTGPVRDRHESVFSYRSMRRVVMKVILTPGNTSRWLVEIKSGVVGLGGIGDTCING